MGTRLENKQGKKREPPALEPTLARGLCLGKPELPTDHVHTLPSPDCAQGHSQCEALKLGEVALDACKRHKHNADNPADNPYVIVGSMKEDARSSNIPQYRRPLLWREPMKREFLIASFGQVISFASPGLAVVFPEPHVSSNPFPTILPTNSYDVGLECFICLCLSCCSSTLATPVFATR